MSGYECHRCSTEGNLWLCQETLTNECLCFFCFFFLLEIHIIAKLQTCIPLEQVMLFIILFEMVLMSVVNNSIYNQRHLNTKCFTTSPTRRNLNMPKCKWHTSYQKELFNRAELEGIEKSALVSPCPSITEDSLFFPPQLRSHKAVTLCCCPPTISLNI